MFACFLVQRKRGVGRVIGIASLAHYTGPFYDFFRLSTTAGSIISKSLMFVVVIIIDLEYWAVVKQSVNGLSFIVQPFFLS